LEVERSALAQAPLWAANTAYAATDVVRLSTGPLLLCTTAGTSHATTEPTITIGSAPAEITDNTAKWWALSEATRVAPSGAIAVTVTDNAGNSALGSIVNFFDNSAQFDQLSAPNVYTPGGAGSTKYCTAWSMLDGSTNDGGFGTNGKQGKYRTIEFVTNADLFEIGYFAITANFLNERVSSLARKVPLVSGASQSPEAVVVASYESQLPGRVLTCGMWAWPQIASLRNPPRPHLCWVGSLTPSETRSRQLLASPTMT